MPARIVGLLFLPLFSQAFAARSCGNPFRACNLPPQSPLPRPAHTSKLTEMSAAVPTTIFTHCCCFLCVYNSCSFIFNCHWPTRFAVRTCIGIKCCQTETDRQTERERDKRTDATDNYNCVIFFSLATFYSRFVFVCRYSLLVSRFPFSISHHMCHRES